jgi:hypothetical protein
MLLKRHGSNIANKWRDNVEVGILVDAATVFFNSPRLGNDLLEMTKSSHM